MIRLAWRQFRAEAVVGLGALVVVAVVLAVTGPHLVDVYRSTPSQVSMVDHPLQVALSALLVIVPALVGIFFGAPLIARELETGTYRLAWTQSVTRTRWLVVKFALVGLACSLLAGGLSLIVAWWANPINLVAQDRFSPANFGMFGIVPFGYALFAFALGATAGLLFRKTLPAMATTLVGYVAARLAVTFWIRPHFAVPFTKIFALSAIGNGIVSSPSGLQVLVQNPTIPNAWVLSTVVANKAGHAPTSAFLSKVCPGLAAGLQPVHVKGSKGVPTSISQMENCISAIGAKFHAVATYQPASRYWPFQIYETLLFLVLVLALAGVSVWWARRRLT